MVCVLADCFVAAVGWLVGLNLLWSGRWCWRCWLGVAAFAKGEAAGWFLGRGSVPRPTGSIPYLMGWALGMRRAQANFLTAVPLMCLVSCLHWRLVAGDVRRDEWPPAMEGACALRPLAVAARLCPLPRLCVSLAILPAAGLLPWLLVVCLCR